MSLLRIAATHLLFRLLLHAAAALMAPVFVVPHDTLSHALIIGAVQAALRARIIRVVGATILAPDGYLKDGHNIVLAITFVFLLNSTVVLLPLAMGGLEFVQLDFE